MGKLKNWITYLLVVVIMSPTGVMGSVKLEEPTSKETLSLDFEDGVTGKWVGNNGETVISTNIVQDEVQGNVLQINPTEHNQIVGIKDVPDIKNGRYSFKIKSAHTDGLGAFIRGSGESYSYFKYRAGWYLGDDSRSTWNKFDDTRQMWQKNKWYNVVVEFEDTHYKMIVDDEVYLDKEYTNLSKESGRCGINITDGENKIPVYVDDIVIETFVEDIIILPDESEQDNELKLWYTNPASDWEKQALPLGNGHMGAMVYGGVATETIQINDKTLWSGGPNSVETGGLSYTGGNVEGAAQYLDDVRDALDRGDTGEVAKYAQKLAGKNRAQNGWGSYQNIGDIHIDFTDIQQGAIIEDYRRELDLNTGIAKVSYEYEGTDYDREYFVNYPSNVMAFKLEASAEDELNFVLRPTIDDVFPKGVPDSSPSTDPDAPTKAYTIEAEGDTITAKGELTDNSMQFEVQYHIQTDGEMVANEDGTISVVDAEEAVIYVATGTNYANESSQFTDINQVPDYRGEDPHDKVSERIEKAKDKGYDQLLQEHLDDYTEIFGRVELDLNQGSNDLTTDKLVRTYTQTKDKNLEVLAYQFGRYLLISSSREGSLPANLQGVWNNKNMAAWAGDYHFNVNLQMNYWPAYVNNLSETALPLIDYVESIVTPGRITAKEHHGVEDGGWTVHTINNPFGMTAPGWSFYWGWSPASAAWICQNLWEYYEFTEDKQLLEEQIYPIMKEAAEFWTKSLVEDKDGFLISSPAYSPEHGPITRANTYEQSLIYQLFTDTIKASEACGIDEEFRATLIEMRDRLKAPVEVGEWGQIKEWYEEDEWENRGFGTQGVEKGHRHLSHLLGLFPGDIITKDTPELFEAAKVSAADRGDGGTGWSKAQKVGIWARLQDGNRAHKIIQEQLTNNFYSNLFSFHPPFQIDGNFGLAAGVGEILIQSHTGTIVPLPALPDEWSQGSVKGLVARGNFEVDMAWTQKQLETMSVQSYNGNNCIIEYPNIAMYEVRDSTGELVEINKVNENRIEFLTQKEEGYTVTKQDEEVISHVNVALEMPSTVESEENFEVTLSVESENAPIYAGDLMIEYNARTLALDSVENVKPHELIASKEMGEGIVRVLTAVPGGSLENSQMLKMNFTALPTDVDRAGQVKVYTSQFGIVKEHEATIKAAEEANCNIVIKGKDNPTIKSEDINQDGIVNVADLALVAYYYQAKASDSHWEQAKSADINKNGKVDITDLSLVASKILEK